MGIVVVIIEMYDILLLYLYYHTNKCPYRLANNRFIQGHIQDQVSFTIALFIYLFIRLVSRFIT